MKHESDRKTAAQFEILAREAEVPKAMRDLVERNIAQMRETYERSKDASKTQCRAGRDLLMRPVRAVTLNRKIIDIAQRNINSSFDLAKKLAGAKNLAEAVEMQSAYWRNQLDTLAAQAEEVCTLSTKVQPIWQSRSDVEWMSSRRRVNPVELSRLVAHSSLLKSALRQERTSFDI